LLLIPLQTIPLVLVSTSDNQQLQQAVAEQYILIDWGSSFLTQHASRIENMSRPMLQFGSAHNALRFLLDAGGAGYFALPMVERYLEEQRLFRVADAPEFARTAYALINKQNRRETILRELLGLWNKP
jgi:DNA-binding transcriptional LysR family regulator